MSERILIRDRIIMKIDAVKLEKGHFRMETQQQRAMEQTNSLIGGKDFVQDTFDKFKYLLDSKDDRRFTRLGEVDGGYSMKKL